MSKYQIVNGTGYSKDTSAKVIDVLERCRQIGARIVLDYGDVETGVSWDEKYDITGRVGRSRGRVKVPLLLYNRRSIGGGSILSQCIIGIKESRGGKVLYSWELENN